MGITTSESLCGQHKGDNTPLAYLTFKGADTHVATTEQLLTQHPCWKNPIPRAEELLKLTKEAQQADPSIAGHKNAITLPTKESLFDPCIQKVLSGMLGKIVDSESYFSPLVVIPAEMFADLGAAPEKVAYEKLAYDVKSLFTNANSQFPIHADPANASLDEKIKILVRNVELFRKNPKFSVMTPEHLERVLNMIRNNGRHLLITSETLPDTLSMLPPHSRTIRLVSGQSGNSEDMPASSPVDALTERLIQEYRQTAEYNLIKKYEQFIQRVASQLQQSQGDDTKPRGYEPAKIVAAMLNIPALHQTICGQGTPPLGESDKAKINHLLREGLLPLLPELTIVC